VEVTETGSSLRRIVCVSSTLCLNRRPVFHHESCAAVDSWKREKAENLIPMLQGSIAAGAKWVCSSTSSATICRLF